MGNSSAKEVTVQGVKCKPYEVQGKMVIDLRPVGFLKESILRELLGKKHQLSKILLCCDDVVTFVESTIKNLPSKNKNMTIEVFGECDKTNTSGQEFGGKYLWRTGEIRIDEEGDIFVDLNCKSLKNRRELRFRPWKKIKELSLTGLGECFELEELNIICFQGCCLKQPVNLPKSQNLTFIRLSNCGLEQLPVSIHQYSNVEFLDLSLNERLGDQAVSLEGLKSLEVLRLNECRLKGAPERLEECAALRELWVTGPDNVGIELEKICLKLPKLQKLWYNRVLYERRGTGFVSRRGKVFSDVAVSLEETTFDGHGEGLNSEIMKAAAKEALMYGEKRNNRISVFFIGGDRVGKTTLKRRLLGESIDFNEPSTIGIQVDVVEVDEKDKTKPWKRSVHQQRMVSVDHVNEIIAEDAAKRAGKNSAAAQNAEAQQLSQDKHHSMFGEDAGDQKRSDDADTVSDREERHTNEVEAEEKSESYVEGAVSDESPKLEDAPAADDKEERKHQKRIATEFILSLELLEVIKKRMANVDQYDDEQLQRIRLLVQDLAGQSLFYDLHAAFLNVRALYILVVGLDEDLHDTAKPLFVDRKTNNKIELVNYLVETNVDYANKWMASLHNLHPDSSHPENLDFIPPATFLAFTKSDTVAGNEEERKRKIEDAENTLLNSFTDHGFRGHVVGTYVLDNTKNEDSELLRLRKDIFETSQKSAMSQGKIPLNWLRLERGLATLMESTPYASFEAVATQLGEASDVGDRLAEALEFLHEQNVIIHFHDDDQAKDLVVLNPQWLLDLFTRVINIPPPAEQLPKHGDMWKRLKDHGQLSSKLLEILLGEHVQQLQALTRMMERVGLICKWDEETWLVPSMAAPKRSSNEAQERLQSCHISVLWMDFEGGFITLGLFTRLQVFLLCRSRLRGGNCPCLSCDFSCIPLEKGDVKYCIVLVQYASRVGVSFVGDDGPIPEGKVPVIASEVMWLVRKGLEEIQKSSPVYKAIKYRFAVQCDCNQPEKTKCARHQVDECSSVECRHLISLVKLQSGGFFCNNIYKMFDGKKGAPWLHDKDDRNHETDAENVERERFIEAVKAAELNMKDYLSICRELNFANPGRDYRDLAGRMGYSRKEVRAFESSPTGNPTDALLSDWGTRSSHTVKKLIEYLKEMGNDDAAKVLERSLENLWRERRLGNNDTDVTVETDVDEDLT